MIRARFWSVVISCIFTISVSWGVDLSAQFADLRDAITAMPMSAQQKGRLNAIADFAEQENADQGVTGFTVSELLEGLLTQMSASLFASGDSSPTDATPAQDDQEALDHLVAVVDEIEARLFFASPAGIQNLPALPETPAGACSVRLLWQLLGGVLIDPGGTIWVRMARLVQLEAQPSETGGTYAWELGPLSEKLHFTEGARFSFRAEDEGTGWIKVQYTAPSGGICSDVIFVKVQGEFPGD